MKYSKIELGISTIIYIFFIFISFNVGSNDYSRAVRNHHQVSYGVFHFVIPWLLLVTTVYLSFFALNFFIVPKFLFQKKIFGAIGLTLLAVIGTGLAATFFFSSMRMERWDYYGNETEYEVYAGFYSRGFAMAGVFLFIYAAYVALREAIAYQYNLSKEGQTLSSRITREVVLIFSIWLAALLPFLALTGLGYFRNFGPFYLIAIPYLFIIYFLNLYWLIPLYKRSGIVKYILMLFATAIAVGILEITFLFQTRQLSLAGYIVIEWFGPTLISLVISWWVYAANAERYEQLTSLKTALGTSNANLQFLRSQINPHFLFNALNTLYGTALMEKADKTGEGIQKLGDMMRFMLHENNQDKIALSRELDYLHNYIDLQNMRLALSPDMVIDIQIEDIIGYYEIAPMLLIPFVENAYKHGISLQTKSWINVNLYKTDDVLHLDVHNSIHPVNVNDPERFQSGTGLDNVKQRLQWLYPQKHDLVIRQNTKEFFIHLSITLNTQKPS